jgi:hypothetical protein
LVPEGGVLTAAFLLSLWSLRFLASRSRDDREP